MILLRVTGMRPEMMERLDVRAWQKVPVDGILHLKPHLGTMKNLQGSMTNIDRLLFSQTIAPCSGMQLCNRI